MNMDWEPIFDEIKTEFPLGDEYVESKRVRTGPVINRIEQHTSTGDDILSIGSGPCVLESLLSRLGYNVTAVDELDNSWHKIGENRERFKQFAEDNGVDFYEKTIGPENPLNKTNFDLVFSLDVIEHLTIPRQFLNSCVTHVRDDGTLLLLTPNAAHLARRIKRLMGKPQPPTAGSYYWTIGEFRGHIKEYTTSEIESLFDWHGLENPEVETIHQLVAYNAMGSNSTLYNMITNLYMSIAGIHPPLKDTILATATKPPGWEPVGMDINKAKEYQNLIEYSNIDGRSDEELIDDIQG